MIKCNYRTHSTLIIRMHSFAWLLFSNSLKQPIFQRPHQNLTSPINPLTTINNSLATNSYSHPLATGDNGNQGDFMSSMGTYDYLFKNNPPDEIDPSIVSMKTPQHKFVEYYYIFNFCTFISNFIGVKNATSLKFG